MLRIYFIFLFSVLIALSSYAQRSEEDQTPGDANNEASKKDVHSPDSVFVSYFSLNDQGAYTRTAVSKPLYQFQEYDVAKQNNQFYANLGNPGSASSPLLFNLKHSPNFLFRSDTYEPYRLKDDSIKIYI